MRRLALALALTGAASASLWAQDAISAHSGTIQYVEGQVQLEGQTVEPKFGEFPEVKNGQTLATTDGRVEVLLTPGVLLRLTDDSSFKMVSNKLDNTSLEVVSGSALIEVIDLLKDNAIQIKVKDATVELSKKGLYRFDADPARLRVYDGEARVTSSGEQVVVAHKGRQVDLNGVLVASNFDAKSTDAFYRWASRRSSYVAAANVATAHAAGQNGLLSLSPYGGGGWAYNPWYGMFTFLPGSGYGYSPFGYSFYSPLTVGYLFIPGLYNTGYYGYGNYGGYAPAPRPTSPSTAATQTAAQARSSFNSPVFAQAMNGSSGGSSGGVASSGGGSVSAPSSAGVGVAAGGGGMGSAGGARGR